MLKKGDIEISYVVLVVLGLVVLIVVLLIFYGGLTDMAARLQELYTEIFKAKPKLT